jgi:hypothetical protein
MPPLTISLSLERLSIGASMKSTQTLPQIMIHTSQAYMKSHQYEPQNPSNVKCCPRKYQHPSQTFGNPSSSYKCSCNNSLKCEPSFHDNCDTTHQPSTHANTCFAISSHSSDTLRKNIHSNILPSTRKSIPSNNFTTSWTSVYHDHDTLLNLFFATF